MNVRSLSIALLLCLATLAFVPAADAQGPSPVCTGEPTVDAPDCTEPSTGVSPVCTGLPVDAADCTEIPECNDAFSNFPCMPSVDECPAGTSGTFPACIPNAPDECPAGTSGTFPFCTPAVGGGACVEPSDLDSDRLWAALCTLAVNTLGATLTGIDADQDQRDDTAFHADAEVFIQLDYFFTDSNAATNDELYGLDPQQPFKVRVDPLLYWPDDGSRLDDADTIGDYEYYLTNSHTYNGPDGPDADSQPDAYAYPLAIIVKMPARSSSNVDSNLARGTEQCVACIDPAHLRVAFGAFAGEGFGTAFVLTNPAFLASDENILDIDVPGVEDSILERSNIDTVLYTRIQNRYAPNAAVTTYPDGTRIGVQAVHVKNPSDPDWRVNFQFRSDLDDDGWADYLELDCGSNPTGDSTCDDFDGDGLSNLAEAGDFYPELAGTQSTDPYDVDSDNDGVWDNLDSDPLALRDFDSDGLSNALDNCPNKRNTANGGDQDDQAAGLGNTASPWYQRDHWGIAGGVPTAGADGIGDHCQDSDGDGILDYKEDDVQPFGSIQADALPTEITTDCESTGAFDTDPTKVDTDGDGLLDAVEDPDKNGVRLHNRDASSPSDNDCSFLETDGNDADSDGDGVSDRLESTGTYAWNGVGPSPGVTNNLVRDQDGDGVLEGIEIAGTNNSFCLPVNGVSKRVDASLTDDCTVGASTSPLKPDSDGDRANDAQERATPFDTDPNNVDTDGDTFGDYFEQRPFVQAVPRIPIINFDTPDPTYSASDPTNAQSKPVSLVPALPVIDPNEPRPDPVAFLTNPDCYMQEDGSFTEECYTTEGVLGDLDSRDGGDTDGDGETDDANNEVDFVEERIVMVDPDEGDPTPEGLEGSNGATFTIYQLRVGGRPVVDYTLRVGDIGASEGTSELVLLYEHRDGEPTYVSCLYTKGGELRQAGFDPTVYAINFLTNELFEDADAHFGNEGQFDPDAEEPCGPSQSLGTAPVDPSTLLSSLCEEGVFVLCPPAEPVDSDGDGVEDGDDRCPGVDDTDEVACPPEPEEPADPCDPEGESFPDGCDPTAGPCAEDPSLPVCGGAPGAPLDECSDDMPKTAGPITVCSEGEGQTGQGGIRVRFYDLWILNL